MIEEVVELWEERKELLKKFFEKEVTEDYHITYIELVKLILKILKEKEIFNPDLDRVIEIDHGNYQGTLLYIIAEEGCMPTKYWCTSVAYGSCSGCDTLAHLLGCDPEFMVDDLMILCLHLVQNIHVIND